MGGDSQMLEMEIIYQGDNSHFCSPQQFVRRIRCKRNAEQNLDCAPSDVVISYLMHSREKVNPMIINSNVRLLTYIMDADANGFRSILRINMVKSSFEGPLNSSVPPPQRPTVDDDLINDNLNAYENDGDHLINIEDDSMHMKDFSSDPQDDEEDRGTAL
ncbi:hypothetical protein CQW23_29985 [Capsicum baccatum]|uniref:Uncharacterized protein n=1 Tax=Capsicum baccatum TaxID=33114 RepID=A0A2G2VBM0_CAPBA|nr:hypothetical protein CQW23_29985 [Capsicum baccatum]